MNNIRASHIILRWKTVKDVGAKVSSLQASQEKQKLNSLKFADSHKKKKYISVCACVLIYSRNIRGQYIIFAGTEY